MLVKMSGMDVNCGEAPHALDIGLDCSSESMHAAVKGAHKFSFLES